MNLALCAVLSRLAAYPQPLLRSFLLNPYLVLQPSVPCLTGGIATLKQRIDSALSVDENAPALVERARHRLADQLAPLHGHPATAKPPTTTPQPSAQSMRHVVQNDGTAVVDT